VNEVLARTLWQGQDSLGQEMAFDKDDRKVRDFALENESGSEMDIPIRQTVDFPTVDLVDRSVSPRKFLDAMRAE